MSFFSKSTWFKDDSEEEKKTPETVIKPAMNVSTAPVSVSGTGAFDAKIYERLNSALLQSNPPGNDYFELRQALASMSGIALDEPTKFKTIFQTLSSTDSKLTKAKLIETAKHYLTVLQDRKADFIKAKETAIAQNVLSKEKNIEANNARIEEKRAAITKLNEEINQISGETIALNQQLVDARTQIQQGESSFNITFDTLSNEINSHIEKINQYI